jgi:sodium transport system ATP-binding protein
MAMIEIVKLTKYFNKSGKPAVDSVSFSVKKGEIVGLIGENGAGKTTIFRMIATMLKPTSGRAIICGYDINSQPKRVRSQIGTLLGGEPGLYDRLTARENIQYFAALNNLHHCAEKEIQKMSAMFSMEKYLNKRVSTLSRGMKQKIAIARSIIHDPPVMLLDEPTTGLDVTSTAMVQQFILKCKNQNKAILFSGHNMGEIEKLSDRVVIISRGKIIHDNTVCQLTHNNNLCLETVFFNSIVNTSDKLR